LTNRANGMINIHDLRNLKQPVVSVFAQPGGIASASYQAHSGLMSTCSYLNPPRPGRRVPNSLASLRPRVTFGMFRATTVLAPVTIEDIVFDPPPSHVVNQSWAPYTVMHPLRPWLGIGYGKNCHLRGSGVGEGDDTDSGSYSFLQSQGQLAGVLGNR
jgi:regulator-associated protein of mTOR